MSEQSNSTQNSEAVRIATAQDASPTWASHLTDAYNSLIQANDQGTPVAATREQLVPNVESVRPIAHGATEFIQTVDPANQRLDLHMGGIGLLPYDQIAGNTLAAPKSIEIHPPENATLLATGKKLMRLRSEHTLAA